VGRRPTVAVIGAGRAGAGLALALTRAGYRVRLYGRRRRRVPKPLTLTVLPAHLPPASLAEAGVVVLAVPDDAIRALAEALARAGAVSSSHVVLHVSGVQGREALDALVPRGAALGSIHPLQTIVDPKRAPEQLRGAWAAVEGMPAAVTAAERLARAMGMRPFRITPQAKAVYHAGAVFASNYFVVVEAVAQRLLRQAGLPDAAAWAALRPLVRGTFENLMQRAPVAALTGPIERGDDATVRRHLESLDADDALLYRTLGRAGLEVARQRGMDAGVVARIAAVLATDRPPAPHAAPRT